MDNDDVISTLNDLIETSKDGEKGFRECAEGVKDPQLKSLFEKRSSGCASAARELQELVRSFGGDPETSGSASGALHRSWTDLKTAITGNDTQAALNECERGEDVALKSYRKALDKVLPPEVRSVIERQYQGVVRNHDEVKALRDQYQSSQNLSRS